MIYDNSCACGFHCCRWNTLSISAYIYAIRARSSSACHSWRRRRWWLFVCFLSAASNARAADYCDRSSHFVVVHYNRVDTARELGVIMDRHLPMSAHVISVCRSAYCFLCQLRQVVRSVSVHAPKTVVHAFISSRLDYCNSLPYGISDNLFHRHPKVWPYLSDDCQLAATTGRRQLRSSDNLKCTITGISSRLGDRAFAAPSFEQSSYTCPSTWL